MTRALLFISFIILLAVPASSSAYTWENVGAARVLRNGSGEIVEHYTGPEWQSWRHQLEATRECLDRPGGECATALTKKETGLNRVNSEVATDAQQVEQTARSDGTSLPGDVASPLDGVSEAGGVLDLGLASTALGVVTLGPAAFKLGVAIGNGLDQLFGLPEWNETEIREKVEAEKPEICTPSLHYQSAFTFHGHGLPNGYYIQCGGAYAATEVQVNMDETECSASTYKSPRFGAPFNAFVTELEEVGNGKGPKEEFCKKIGTRKVVRIFEWYEPECELPFEVEDWLYTGSQPCEPIGVPNTGLLNSTQEAENVSHGKPAHPEVPAVKPAEVGHARPIPEEALKRFTESEPARTYVTTHSPYTVKELSESEAEEGNLEIPAPYPNELGTEYVTELEQIGFTNVTSKTVGESAENTTVGPNQVARVAPAPGTRASAGTHIEVDINPSDAPSPGGGSPFPGPEPPGFHLPEFAVLCTKFPFGVPCWIVSEMEKWVTTQETPAWEIPLEVPLAGWKTTIKLNLGFMNSAMEIVRPILLSMAVIGVVFMFFHYAMGGTGAPPGGDSDE
jgi:hypothetical protein